MNKRKYKQKKCTTDLLVARHDESVFLEARDLSRRAAPHIHGADGRDLVEQEQTDEADDEAADARADRHIRRQHRGGDVCEEGTLHVHKHRVVAERGGHSFREERRDLSRAGEQNN